MRKLVNSTFVSLDGVINHMERWHFGYIDDESDAVALEQLAASDALLMGRRTYETYAEVWPSVEGEYANRINAVTKYVASTTLEAPTWQNATVLDGELVDAVTTLKEAPGADILMHGYGPVAKSLLKGGLLDELILWVHPVLAGVGRAEDMLLERGLNAELTLIDVRSLRSGVVLLRYAGAPE